jgi:hypothetical protein
LAVLREVAQLHVYYWAGTPAAAAELELVAPPSNLLRPSRPASAGIDAQRRPERSREVAPQAPQCQGRRRAA